MFTYLRGADTPDRLVRDRRLVSVTKAGDEVLDEIDLDPGAGTGDEGEHNEEVETEGERTGDAEPGEGDEAGAGDEADAGERGEADGDEPLSESERATLTRYKQQVQDRQKIAEERNRLQRELATLKASQAAKDQALADAQRVDPEAFSDRLATEVFQEASKIDSKDPDERTRLVYKLIIKKAFGLSQQAVTTALQAVEHKEQQRDAQRAQVTAEQQDAIDKAKIALDEVGLDPETYFPHVQRLVNTLLAEKPKWFEAVPVEEQYMRLANKVKATIDANRTETDEHRREAQGLLGRGPGARPARSKGSDEGAPAPATMAEGMGLLAKGRRAKASALFNVARAHS